MDELWYYWLDLGGGLVAGFSYEYFFAMPEEERQSNRGGELQSRAGRWGAAKNSPAASIYAAGIYFERPKTLDYLPF